ncbi:tetratricopeptide repeat protein [Niveibacterium sp.]|uniref:tetratricopeptide repeat protein n=1 Tax=Niveibacterium sp. TaxID=2017444 RepID=UPI0035B35DA8
MSFTLTVWAQPEDLPLPTDVMQAQAQLDAAQDTPGTQPEPRFLALARALDARFPNTEDGDGDMYDHGLEILEKRPDNDRYYNIGLWARDDSFEVGFNHLVVQANDLGLHVMDGQNGAVYLANGEVLAFGAHSRTARLDDALSRKDWPAAWAECRRLAPRKEAEAWVVWGLMVTQGRMAPAHPALGAALAQFSGVDATKDRRVEWCLKKVSPALAAEQSRLLAGLRAAADVLAYVDTELQRAPAPAAVGGGAAPATPPDAATAAAATAMGIDPALVARAEAGSAQAQCKLAIDFLHATEAAVPGSGKLALLWLERSAAQGQSLAQALLGEGLLRGWRGFPIDMERGIGLLEAAAAADDVDGLNYLAQFLYEKSVRRPPGADRIEKRSDPTSLRYQARVPELLMRAAALGSPRALFWLAVRLYDEIGTPRDDIAAKAVMQLARTRAAKVCAEHPGVFPVLTPTPDESAEVLALARELDADIKRLPVLLKARLAARTPAPAPVVTSRATSRPMPASAAQSESDLEDEPDDAPRRALHGGHVALVIGALSLAVLLTLAPSVGRGGLKVLMLLVSLVGAWGVWRSTADLEWDEAKRAFLAVLALIPGIGFIVCIAVLLRVVRGE